MKNFKIGDKVRVKVLDSNYDHLDNLNGTVVEEGAPEFLPCAGCVSVIDNKTLSYLVDLGEKYGRNYFISQELSLVKE